MVVRGYDLTELAQRTHFADVAFLLIHGSLPGPGQRSMFANALGDGAMLPEGMRHVIEALPPRTHPMDALRTGISALASFEPRERLEDPGHGAIVTKGVRVLSAGPTIVANAYRAAHDLPSAEPEHDLSYPSRFLRMIPGAATDDEAVAIFDRVLTCHAEDGPADSALVARAVAGASGDIYGAVAAVTAALKGRLHGEIGGAAPRADPRGALLHRDLLTLTARRDRSATHVTANERAADVMQREKGLSPDADLPSTLILSLLDVPVELFAPIFLCAHTAGLVAHVIEQHDRNNGVDRTRERYERPSGLHLPQDFVPAPL